VELDVRATRPGTAHVFLWAGDHAAIPVFLTNCSPATDPPPDYGLTACDPTDGGTPPWSPDMSGRLVRDVVVSIGGACRQHLSIPFDHTAHDNLVASGSVLASFETPNDEVQALFVPLSG
jgi:hypothetical protein